MFNSLDQIFVNTLHWLMSFVPDGLRPIVAPLTCIAFILMVFPLFFSIVTIFERKGLGRIQNRYGPNRVGIPFTKIRLCGFGQFLPDGLKMLTKEDIVPRAADKIVHFLAPVVMLIPVLLAYAVLPFGRNMTVADYDAGLLFFFAVGGAVEISVFMAGWSSRNKYSLLGAMRAIAQMVSYEIPLILSAVTVVMIVGSLNMNAIVAHQNHYTFGIAHWNVFTPWGLLGFALFFIASLAETNRTPFDLPEAESEIIAGYFTEYSGFKFALFFLGEYLGMFAISGLGITLFLGGWTAPFSFLTWIPSWIWFFTKLLAIIFVFIWIRGTLPRLRMDQLMNFAWKFMLPLALINILVAGIWHFMGHGLLRWLACLAVIAIAYVTLGRGLMQNQKLGKRTYQFAD
ncbi:MAG TPA: NADH-quinone oxidoreductase subunit NuoH [Candidatus Binatia bacterium]|nr:NADH-quinone oxidoreductase subunit NuoH [Candidatus Binatia bacterium]